jgi:predicted O-linked N-acetylglucosamine transferase (SPINDLY family)
MRPHTEAWNLNRDHQMANTNFGVIDFPSADSRPSSAVSRVTVSLAATRRELATQWAALPPADVEHHYAGRLGQIHRLIHGSGLRDTLPDDADRAFIADLKASLSLDDPRQAGAGKLLAAMLFLHPHELPHLFELTAVPAWLSDDYTFYMLASPMMFREIGEAAAYREFAARWTTYLRDMVAANIHTELGRNVGALFTKSAIFVPLYFNTANLRDIYRNRAAIMETTLSALNSPLDHVFGPRPDRPRLRLGILAAHFAPQTETYATLPVYRHLDRARFEVILFSLQQTNHPPERYCAQYADRFVVLPPQLGTQLQTIRAADLDLIFLGTNTTASGNDFTLLALYRLARVQVAGVCSCTTTGMRNIDYYLSGRLSEPPDAQSHYTEKLLMVDGPAHCYDFTGEAPCAPTQAMTREGLGIPNDAVVFVSGANFFKILPELDETWMRVLSAVPRSRLVLYPFNLNWTGTYPVDTFMERLSAAAARHDVDPHRLIVFNPAPNKADILERVRLGDIYLDSFPFSGATSLLDPLAVGLPTVVKDGTSFRTLVAAALLRTMELDELIARDSDTYVALAVKLAGDAGLRNSLRARIRAKMDNVPKFLDGKWYGQQAGAAFEQMWKERAGGR